MDKSQGWSKITAATKSAADTTTNTLDAVAPICAPFAARWDAEADRRNKLRTPENLKALMDAQRAHNSARSTAAIARSQRRAARAVSRNPLAAGRRAARTADKAARQDQDAARAALKKARAAYPATLKARAIQAHALHVVPASAASWVMANGGHLLGAWPAGVSAGLIGANAAALWLGRRTVSVQVEDGLSAEERQLTERLDPSYWVQHAADRGLSGTVTTPPEVTAAGIVCGVRLDGTWTLDKLRGSEAHVRALLGARTALPILIKPGARGGWASIVLRTRSAADAADLRWTPGAAFGVDTITGEDVRIPLGQRMLIAGRSGTGKSWSARPLLYEASAGPVNALVVIDLKMVEANNWTHRARTAITPEQVVEVVAELVEEMTDRLRLVPRGEDTITPTPELPRITVFVDEGAEVVTAAKEALTGLESIARMGRAACIDLWWATQKPTMSGASAGIPAQIAPQLSTIVSLAVSTPTEARTVLGEDAQARGWNADALPAPGYALVRSGPASKPNPVRTRALSPKQVVALPGEPIWHRSAGVPAESAAAAGRPALRLVKGEDYVLAPPAATPAAEVPEQAGPVTNRDRVLAAVRDGARTARDITDRTGLNKGTVSREVKALITAGALRKGDDGMLTAGEVSA